MEFERSDNFIYYMNKLEKLLLDQSDDFTTKKVYDIVEQLIKERNKYRPIVYPKGSLFYEGDDDEEPPIFKEVKSSIQ